MAQSTLEKRVAALEQQMARLMAEVEKLAQPKDWRSTLGMFAGDETMQRIQEAGRKIREADRQQAKRAGKKRRQRAKP